MSYLPGSERYARPPSESTRRRDRNMVLLEEANGVPIWRVLARHGIQVPETVERSWKTYCPFGFEHPDGGIERAMRVYPSNTAYCFAAHGLLTPVRIVQIESDCRPLRAAHLIAERFGLRTDEPYWERMGRLVLEAETKRVRRSYVSAVEAMAQALEREPGYVERQLDDAIVTTVESALEELEGVMERTGALREWLNRTVERVRVCLDSRPG